MGAVRRHARRLWRKKVRNPARAALRGLAQSWCPDCQRNADPFHTCAPKSDFRRRRAQQASTERRRDRKRARPSGQRRERREHDYATCRDRECPRPLCRAFREGQQSCPLPHQ